ncbi:predicted protein [Nematostella vectensis]|uniref:Uncharacterized protein n=1 Tax=Nematostella vectensis TaxID=45351 RepID=A7SPS2_NEMVE|nr:predicted protein [Nematostella vectensis]|eukprot:XP_001626418.1 predicted protein [Nematostella vectensis]
MEDFRMSEDLAIRIAKERFENITRLGHQFDSLVRKCSWRGSDCRANATTGRYWGRFWHNKYGNCFVFNPLIGWNGKKRRALTALRAGPNYGLTLELNVEQDEYIDGLSTKAGAVIQVSPVGYMPFPEEEGIDVSPGFSTSIALTKVKISRVDAFGNRSCVNEITEKDRENLYHVKYNATYSKTACLNFCLAYNQRKTCNCMEYRFPVEEEAVCDTMNKTTVECLRRVREMLKMKKLNCTAECSAPCNQETYKTTSSFSMWPALNYKEKINKNMKWKKPEEELSHNLLQARIFYKEFNMEMIEETISYEVRCLANLQEGPEGVKRESGFALFWAGKTGSWLPGKRDQGYRENGIRVTGKTGSWLPGKRDQGYRERDFSSGNGNKHDSTGTGFFKSLLVYVVNVVNLYNFSHFKSFLIASNFKPCCLADVTS